MSVQSFKKMALVGMLLVPGLLMAQEVSSWETSPAAAPAPVASESAPVASESVAAEPAATVYTAKPRTAATLSTAESSDMQMYRSMYESGASTQKMGRILSWGGMGLSVIGTMAGNSTLSGVGGLALMVGIPVNGVGSGRMAKAANGMKPTAQIEHRGWVPYWTGWALVGGGMYLLFDGSVDYAQATMDIEDIEDGYYYGNSSSFDSAIDDAESRRDDAQQKIITGAIVALVGEVCWFVGWYKFSASADDASFAYNSVQVGVAPLLVPEKEGTGFAKGMQLTAAF